MSDPVTITRWNEDTDEDDVIEVTEELVTKLKDSADMLAQVLNRYIQARGSVDPEFKNVPEFELGGSDDISFDLEGSDITVEWKEYGRCGDHDYFRRSFPLSDLWNPEWGARVEAEAKAKAQAEAEKRAAADVARKKAAEERERGLLRSLQAKYGGAP